jgi:hypothetical protein
MEKLAVTTVLAAVIAAATLTAASIGFSSGAVAKPKDTTKVCNEYGCVTCVSTLDGDKCYVVLKPKK